MTYSFVTLTISRVSLVKLKVSGRMSMLVALSSLSRRSVEMLNCIWSSSKRVTLDLVSFSPNGSSLSVNPIRALIRPGRGSFCRSRKGKMCYIIQVVCYILCQWGTVPYLPFTAQPLQIHKNSTCQTCNLLAWFLVGTLGMTLTTVPSNCSMLISSKMTVPWGSSLTSVATSLPYGHKNIKSKHYIHKPTGQ